MGMLPDGLYTVKVKTPSFLTALLPGIQTVSQGLINSMPAVTLIAGDINGDNLISILDYNILMGCYSDLLPPSNCSPANRVLSDLNDDNAVNGLDYNIFVRSLANRSGQ